MNDYDLLRDFVAGSEDAFAMLLKRHVNAVYSVALRTVHSPELAEEVACSVFTELARNAARMKPNAPLIAWLFQVARRTGIDALRREQRRRARELRAVEESFEPFAPVSPDALAFLDAALERLKASDREILLLRYFQDQSVEAVARTLSIKTDTAQKRLERAIARLRTCFGRRGIAVTAASLGTTLASGAAQPAPAALPGTIISAVKGLSLAATAAHFGGFAFISTAKKAALVAILGGALATGLYQHSSAERANAERRAAALALAKTREDLSETEARLAQLEAENARLRESNRELPRLRGEVTALRQAAPQNARSEEQQGTGVSKWAHGVEQLQTAVAASSENFIPEMSLLKDKDWLEASAMLHEPIDDALAKALAKLRTLAKGKYALYLSRALQKFVAENEGRLPTTMFDLAPLLDHRADPAALSRYKLVRSGTTNELRGFENIIFEDSAPSQFDTKFGIGLGGAGYANPKAPGSDQTYGFSIDFDEQPED